MQSPAVQPSPIQMNRKPKASPTVLCFKKRCDLVTPPPPWLGKIPSFSTTHRCRARLITMMKMIIMMLLNDNHSHNHKRRGSPIQMNREPPPLPPSTEDNRHNRRRNLNIFNIACDEVWLERFELERILLSPCVCLFLRAALSSVNTKTFGVNIDGTPGRKWQLQK